MTGSCQAACVSSDWRLLWMLLTDDEPEDDEDDDDDDENEVRIKLQLSTPACTQHGSL